VLFIEPAADPVFDVSSRRTPSLPRFHSVSHDGRIRAFRPLKPLPRRAGPLVDTLLHRQIVLATRLLGFSRPTLWINDVTYAPLITTTGWPSVYDVTDDWLLAPFAARELERLRRLDELALNTADQVVVCSQALAASRGARRAVSLIPNGVDVEHFRRPQTRPRDLPIAPVAVYVGSLHDARIDIELIVELARTLPQLKLVLVGPNSLGRDSQHLLDRLPNVFLLGPRPYLEIPGYLQHADVVVVPHRVSPFTESLDPIKAYECLALDTPTVATPVAGFREHSREINVVERDTFSAQVARVISQTEPAIHTRQPAGWEERAIAFEAVLKLASGRRDD
jgi:glycosyltransferase involved in cell wall biosynthesis